jgi:uncharacterized protein DUF6526
METQNYSNHTRYVFLYHVVLFVMLLLILIGACVNLYRSIGDHQRLYSASLIVALSLSLFLISFFARTFPLKAQDRAIRAEENLRHYVLTGKLLDPRLTVPQILALRFAPDDEFVALAEQAAGKSLPADDIKKAIRNWKADTYRV